MDNKATELNTSIRRTIEQLANETDAARQSQLFRDYLRTSAAFWNYSWHNQMLIWKQVGMPHTRVEAYKNCLGEVRKQMVQWKRGSGVTENSNS